MIKIDAVIQRHEASIRNLEVQIDQLSQHMNVRPLVALPNNTEVNPKEQMRALNLQSGKQLPEPVHVEKKVVPEEMNQCHHESGDETIRADVSPHSYQRSLSYPQRFQKLRYEENFKIFSEIFKKLHVNISFAELLEKISSYSKFMKEILSKKKKIKNAEVIALTEECSAMVKR